VAWPGATLVLNGALSSGNAYVILRTTGNLTRTFNGLVDTAQVQASPAFYIHYVTSASPNYIVLNESSSPTAVVLTGFRVATGNGKVTVIWTTSGEADTLGFDVYRQLPNGAWEYVDHVNAKGPGSTYSMVDTTALPGQAYSYRLVELTATGPKYYEFDNLTGDEFVLRALDLTPAGVQLSWLGWAGEKYRVWKCTDLGSGHYSVIASNLDATPPENVFVDTNLCNSAFYRIELQQ
jgi:hypothetical protein